MEEDEDETEPEDQLVEDMNDEDELWVSMKIRPSLRICIWRMMRKMTVRCGGG